MPLPPSHKHKAHQSTRKFQYYQKNKYKKYPKYNKQHKTFGTKPKKDVKCFICGKKGHISPNCKKYKINALFDEEDEYHEEVFFKK